jgi:AP-1-like factor
LADLQARIQQYEQGDIERNVALQNVAKRLKEENEKLKNDNAQLLEELASVKALLDKDRKRSREDDLPIQAESSHSKKPKCETNFSASFLASTFSQATSPMSMISTPSPVSPPSELYVGVHGLYFCMISPCLSQYQAVIVSIIRYWFCHRLWDRYF